MLNLKILSGIVFGIIGLIGFVALVFFASSLQLGTYHIVFTLLVLIVAIYGVIIIGRQLLKKL